MSMNVYQIYQANPATSMNGTDLMYFGRSPYNSSDDFAIEFVNFVSSIGTATPTASTISEWDVNLNMSANNFLPAYTTTATAAALTTLTVASSYMQFFTGTTTQTVKMPVTSTLALGQSWLIVNNSTGVVTVESSGANTIQAMAAGTSLLITCNSLSGTTAASWQVINYAVSDATYPLSVLLGGTGKTSVTVAPAATSWAGWDSNVNMSANNFIPGFQAIATAAGTTTLTVSTPNTTQFTGSTTQNCAMPVVSTLVLGMQFVIVNSSTGIVTVQSSGGNTIQAMAANTTLYLMVQAVTGTSAASWLVLSYNGIGFNLL